MKRVLIGMSGGVDSSVAALLLREQGYEVCGCTLKLYDNEMTGVSLPESGCCSVSDILDAASVCRRIGIDHITLNLCEEFEEYVIKPFAESYAKGMTPNPCIECNRHLKFDLMLKKALNLGFDYVATGHYANIKKNEATGRYELFRPSDRKKDQTYVLYRMTQHQLEHTLFPLWSLEKTEIRRIAAEQGFVNSSKPDSQDICFVADGAYGSFLEKYTGREEKKGYYTDKEGNILGEHSGISRYTIGQRRGIGIALGRPVFVTEIDPVKNIVTLGDEEELFRDTLIIDDINLITTEDISSLPEVTAKTRYTHKETPAKVFPLPDGRAEVRFLSPVRAPAPGQACVFYDGDRVAGGGRIISSSRN